MLFGVWWKVEVVCGDSGALVADKITRPTREYLPIRESQANKLRVYALVMTKLYL